MLLGGCDYDEEEPIFMAPGSYGDVAVVVSSASLQGGVEQFIGQMNEEYTFVLSRESLFNVDTYPPDRWELAKGYKNIIVLWRVGDGGPVEKMLRGRLTDAGEARAARPRGALIELEEPFASYQHALVLAAPGRQELPASCSTAARTTCGPGSNRRTSSASCGATVTRASRAAHGEPVAPHRFFMEIPGAFRLNQDEPDGYPGVELMRRPRRGVSRWPGRTASIPV